MEGGLPATIAQVFGLDPRAHPRWKQIQMPSILDIAVYAVAAVLSGALAWRFRAKGIAACALIVLISFPLLLVATTALTLLISFQVFGIDLLD